MPGYCSQCGTTLAYDARFCPECGRPVGAAAPVATPPMSYSEKYAATPYAGSVAVPAPRPAKTGLSPLQVIAGVVVLLIVVGAVFLVLKGGLPGASAGGTAGNIPPVGQIWFGASFDTTTFALSGITTSTPTGATVALVAQLPHSVASGDLNLRVSLDGTVILNQNVTVKGSGELFGSTVGPFVAAGTYGYELVDVGGNALASGTLTVTAP